jgi:hypothetical protein
MTEYRNLESESIRISGFKKEFRFKLDNLPGRKDGKEGSSSTPKDKSIENSEEQTEESCLPDPRNLILDFS